MYSLASSKIYPKCKNLILYSTSSLNSRAEYSEIDKKTTTGASKRIVKFADQSIDNTIE